MNSLEQRPTIMSRLIHPMLYRLTLNRHGVQVMCLDAAKLTPKFDVVIDDQDYEDDNVNVVEVVVSNVVGYLECSWVFVIMF